MFHRYFRVVLGRRVDYTSYPALDKRCPDIFAPSVELDVDLVSRTVSIPENTSGEFDLDSFLRAADALRMALDCHRTGILELPNEYMPTSSAVLRWLFRYIFNVIGGVDV